MAKVENGEEAGGLEFRNYTDDAWYSVREVERDSGDFLIVKYTDFGDDSDNLFRVDEFRDLKHLTGFASRFRPVSLQLQDFQCSTVVPGLLVCANHEFKADDVRFYDAIVEGVSPCFYLFIFLGRKLTSDFVFCENGYVPICGFLPLFDMEVLGALVSNNE